MEAKLWKELLERIKEDNIVLKVRYNGSLGILSCITGTKLNMESKARNPKYKIIRITILKNDSFSL